MLARRYLHFVLSLGLVGMGLCGELGAVNDGFNSKTFSRVMVPGCVYLELDNLFWREGSFRQGLFNG
jgi:hypothetical protein